MALDDRLPRYQQLRDELAAQIAAQTWRPGDALPAETELAKRYGVALGTMRKGIELLVAEGLLERSHGRGTFVRRVLSDVSMFRFFRFRDEAGRETVPQGRILEIEPLPAPEVAARRLRLKPGSKAISIRRVRLFADQPALAERIWLPHKRFEKLLKLDRDAYGDLLYPVYQEVCEQVVARADEELTVGSADAETARLLKIRIDAPVIVIERLAYGLDGTPLEWRVTRGPADKFHYSVEIR